MADVLIRNVPEDILEAIDADARRQGLSQGEYLRRLLERAAHASGGAVTVDDLTRFSEAFPDLADPEAMKRAWE
ncbi:ribbon-helix-helix protein, CopG family [Nocardiopsis dassonvillei]|uniref:type II toxin-antitoxin system VapB family antitoxin n=1 Tax=Nocardiopsis dassonvillei TaxID=2014 RepID=UPI00200F8E00|nr:ribbon-helix-helix protein, CopG family [Nocardiopsis dassonvillei]MCK9872147.1 ribbon-helix-helix protein, CopG family [Nocardiopsis dassonvillei]